MIIYQPVSGIMNKSNTNGVLIFVSFIAMEMIVSINQFAHSSEQMNWEQIIKEKHSPGVLMYLYILFWKKTAFHGVYMVPEKIYNLISSS